MPIISEVFIIDVIFIMLLILLLIYYYATKTFDHFDKIGIKYIKPVPFFGNMTDFVIGRKNLQICHKDIYDKLKGEKCGGMFMNRSPFLMICDPELIQKVLIKDFSYFYDRGTTTDEKLDPLQANLINLEGQRWKSLRQKLTPAFSSGKLKMMFQQFNECTDELLNHLQEIEKNNQPADARETMAKFSTDVIGSCAFGLQFNSLKDPDSKFRKVGREILSPTLQGRVRLLLRIIHDKLPTLLGLKAFKKEAEEFFINLVKDTINYRETNKIERNDFIQIMMTLRKQDSTSVDNNTHKIQSASSNQHNEEEKQGTQVILDDKLLAANTFIFFLAGFETTASTLSLCLFELALNGDIQTRLRNEIITVINNSKTEVTHDVIKNMTYMDCVISETLRKYPIAGSLIRKCTKPYNLPGTSIIIKKNQRIFIPVYGIHHDPQYYPDPEKFDPERFNEENKEKRPYGTYLPFGDGPRICIGLRFAIAEIKVALAKILSKYELKLNNNMEMPLRWKPRRLLLVPEQKILLDLQPIEENI
ncbi:putative cytochrome P450 6a14 [Lycorma delicatula]|uniref:putative cytochrome P450 6a14 n=1 Tax=Lycorma delicatula TaxID=130591 RepID=UPI003F516ACA